MAVTVDWADSIINVARADMTLIQSTPTEIRVLDTNAFRLELRDLEDDEDGRPFPVTHNHNADVLVGGVQLADVLIIREPYTITFEDGQYAVYLQGTNNNILERTNKNQVSVNPSNSAGLVTSSEIQFAVYNGGITLDADEGIDKQIYPAGTPFEPTSDVANVEIIRTAQKLPRKIYLNSDYTLGASAQLNDYIIEGQNHVEIQLVIESAASVERITILDCTVSGVMDGQTVIRNCQVGTITYLNGHIHNSAIAGKITLGGGADAYIADCAMSDMNIIPEIDCGGSGQNLSMPSYDGLLLVSNLNGASNKIGIGLNAGRIILDSTTITAGTIIVSGQGQLMDESGNDIVSGTWNGGVTIENTLTNVKDIHKVTLHKAVKSGNILTVFENDGVTVWKQFDLSDGGRVPV